MLEIKSLELECLHRKLKVDSKCRLARDEISNDVITLGTCFSMFVYIRACFRFVVIEGNLTAQLIGNHRGIGRGIQN